MTAQFLVTPTSIVASVGDGTRLIRIDQGETHLERLADLNRIMGDVRSGDLSARNASDMIRESANQPPRYGVILTVLAFALAPGSLGITFLQAFVGSDIPLGVESAFTMMILAISLVTGLFLANLTLRPRPL